MGRKKRHLIGDDEDLSKLLRSQPIPTVHVDHDNVEDFVAVDEEYGEQSGEEVYVPSFEAPESSGYGYNTQSTQVDDGLDVIKRYASLNWLGDDDDQQTASMNDQRERATYNQPWPIKASQHWQDTHSGEWPSWEETSSAGHNQHWQDTSSAGYNQRLQNTPLGEWLSWE